MTDDVMCLLHGSITTVSTNLKTKKIKGEHYDSASKTNQKHAYGDVFDHAANYVEQGQQDVDTYFDRIA